jgi:predicted transcriptional regulator
VLRIPSPTLLSLGLVAPPAARKVAAKVPVVESAQNIQTLAEHRIVVVEDHGVPIGVTGLKRERITSWEELVKIDGSVAVTDLRRVLAHEPLVVVLEGGRVAGVVTQEMYLGGLWGTVR